MKRDLRDAELKSKKAEVLLVERVILIERVYRLTLFKDREAIEEMTETNKKLKEVNDYTKRLTDFLEAISKGDEPPIELFLRHNRGLRNIFSGKNDKKTLENDSREANIKKLSQANLAVVEVVQSTYVDCMDRMCETYALRYGNECSLQ